MSAQLRYDEHGPELQCGTLAAESEFYRSYGWCINAFPSIRDIAGLLEKELTAYLTAADDWRRDEMARNVFLFSCAIADSTDDYLLGRIYDFSKAVNVLPALKTLTKVARGVLAAADLRWCLTRGRVMTWRAQWEAAVDEVLQSSLLASPATNNAPAAARRMTQLLAALPTALLSLHPRIPAAFRSQDLTHFDVLSLGEKFIAAFPDRNRPILITGLRTAGSYFASLLRAYLRLQGYNRVEAVTIRPKKAVADWEKERISRCATEGGLGIVVDEPIGTGGTVGEGIGCLVGAGIAPRNIVALVPVHRCGRNWRNGPESQALTAFQIITLEPEEWHKHRIMESAESKRRLAEYLLERGWADAVVENTGAEHLEAHLQTVSEEKFHTRLKRVYAVRLTGPAGCTTRYIFAKSVGWGWLGYHAFIAGERLAEHIPPILGLRDGILYAEWCTENSNNELDRAEIIRSLGSYVGCRAQALRFEKDPGLDLLRETQPARGLEEIAGVLSRAFGSKIASVLKRSRVKQDLTRLLSNRPSLIDGRMRRIEWVQRSGALLKTDFEHHGMGKHELNITDPAFDLAEAVLHWNLSEGEERELLNVYAARTDDPDIGERIFLYKLLAGSWSMARAVENLTDPNMSYRHGTFNQQYLDALDFLTLQTTRFCAGFCRKPQQIRWNSPLAVLDVDGVVDKNIFGFPSTTAAGIQAISLLHEHGIAVALNTARTVTEVKEYSRAYGFAGGVAEYGAHIWDAVADTERVLVTDESLEQIERLKSALRQIPGVFINNAYRYSIRSYTYERGVTVPLPRILIQNLMADLGLNRLILSQTYVDSTVVAGETNKGRGMLELLRLAGIPDAQTCAVGDSAPDLAMFRVATRSFAPGHITCRPAARLLGCHVAGLGYQPGLLESARAIVHSGGDRCDRCRLPETGRSEHERYFLRLLTIADRKPLVSLGLAVLDPMARNAFLAD
jgi:hydroxymethylpyrimidine pyrophosphatase-like HAD family hydrolase